MSTGIGDEKKALAVSAPTVQSPLTRTATAPSTGIGCDDMEVRTRFSVGADSIEGSMLMATRCSVYLITMSRYVDGFLSIES